MNYHEILGIVFEVYASAPNNQTTDMLRNIAQAVTDHIQISQQSMLIKVNQDVRIDDITNVTPCIEYIGDEPDLDNWYMCNYDKPYLVEGVWHIMTDFIRIGSEDETESFVLRCTDKQMLVDFVTQTVDENENLYPDTESDDDLNDDSDDVEEDLALDENDADDAARYGFSHAIDMTEKKTEPAKAESIGNGSEQIKLSPRETELRQLLQNNPDMTDTEIAKQWEVTPGAVWQIRRSLKTKLNLVKPIKDRK